MLLTMKEIIESKIKDGMDFAFLRNYVPDHLKDKYSINRSECIAKKYDYWDIPYDSDNFNCYFVNLQLNQCKPEDFPIKRDFIIIPVDIVTFYPEDCYFRKNLEEILNQTSDHKIHVSQWRYDVYKITSKEYDRYIRCPYYSFDNDGFQLLYEGTRYQYYDQTNDEFLNSEYLKPKYDNENKFIEMLKALKY